MQVYWGKTKGASDKALSQMQQDTPEQYQKYYNFTRVTAPALANEMRRTLGGQASDKEIQIMGSVANPLTWDSNPKLAMGQWDALKNLFQKQVAGAISASPSQNRQNLINGLGAQPTMQAPQMAQQMGAPTIRTYNPQTGAIE